MDPVVALSGLSKTYASGLVALQPIDLTIERGEMFALLGPNGAGKTTLIDMVCGIVAPTSGQALINGHDMVRDYRAHAPASAWCRRNWPPRPSKPRRRLRVTAVDCSAIRPTRPTSNACSAICVVEQGA